MTISEIAKVCHEANRAYCDSIGGESWMMPWEDSPDWQRESHIHGVEAIIDNPHRSPQESHEGWLEEKRSDGWVYGPEKDPNKKTHPCMVPYDDIPAEQRIKDTLFTGIVKALLPLLETEKVEEVETPIDGNSD